MRLPAGTPDHRRRARRIWAPAILAFVLTAERATAQDAFRCDGHIVSAVIIGREPPALISESAPEWSRPLLAAGLQHVTTEPTVIRSFLLLEEGGICSEFRRAESERLLRAQPFLADATVRATPDGTGGVRIEVETADEIPLVIGARARADRLTGFAYGSANLLGKGAFVAAEWREGFAYRDGFAAHLVHYHATGRPIRATAHLERSSLGGDYSVAIERPFHTTLQRTAWHAGLRDVKEYVTFQRRDQPALSLGIERRRGDIGGVVRFGIGAGRFFGGPYLTYERLDVSRDPVIITETGLEPGDDPTLVGRYSSLESARIAGVVGVRLLRYVVVEGFDALIGSQDVGVGLQLALIGGQGMGRDDEGPFFGAELHGATGTNRSLIAIRATWEQQRGPDGWVDGVGSGRLAWYAKPSERGTWIVSAEAAGAHRSRRPFQLALGDARAGLRGYRDSRIVGERLAVVRAERRWVVGEVTRHLGLGAAGFADVGRTWAGSAPFGESTSARASVGVALLAAVPAHSRRLLRLEAAVPVVRDRHARYEIRLITTTPFRTIGREPGDIARLRSVAPPSSLFGWP
ncbi:MAG TPA: hypothetical protein VMM18_02560 [Gemmatimonadaceae bacterium]|nr:hypothetical protein [Gemmatimonadaceae bacterium]